MPTLYKHHALAALLIAVGLDPRVQLAQWQPFQRFERLGQLSAEHGNSIATEHISKVAKRFQYAVRSFVEDQRTRLFFQCFEPCTSCSCLGRQKAFEDESIRGQPSRRQCGDQRTSTRHRHHCNPSGTRLAHQVISRIGNQRRTRIGDQRDILSTLQPPDESPPLFTLVMLVASCQRRLNTEVREQPRRVTGILRGYQRHLSQHPQRSGTDVLQIADRRGDDIKRPHSGIRTTAGSHKGLPLSRKCAL